MQSPIPPIASPLTVPTPTVRDEKIPIRHYPELLEAGVGNFLPQELKFVCSREPKDFGRFALVWSLKFPEYELDTVVESKEEGKVNVWLRLKKETAHGAESAA